MAVRRVQRGAHDVQEGQRPSMPLRGADIDHVPSAATACCCAARVVQGCMQERREADDELIAVARTAQALQRISGFIRVPVATHTKAQ